MIPCDRSFGQENTYEDNGVTIYRWYHAEWTGNYDLTFRFISTNSPLPQGIHVFMSKDFKGFMEFGSEKLGKPKTAFGHYTFREADFPDHEFTLKVRSTCGKLLLLNCCQRPNSTSWISGWEGLALWVENIGENHYRFHCNDCDYDDDFDDLVFDILVSVVE